MPEAQRPRISVINDNPDFLELMSAILDEDAGYDVTLFDGEKTTIAEIAASDPQLIIVDLILGGASGWELVTLSRADERLAGKPILVCSADVAALRERSEELERIGNVHILEKPFSIDQITEVVDRLVSGVGAGTASG
jgi:DNA-binding response OmpR family regulator